MEPLTNTSPAPTTIQADNPDRLLRQDEAAAIIGVTGRALEAWRCNGGGPKFVRISSRCIRYRKQDLDAWIESLLQLNTSQGPQPTPTGAAA